MLRTAGHALGVRVGLCAALGLSLTIGLSSLLCSHARAQDAAPEVAAAEAAAPEAGTQDTPKAAVETPPIQKPRSGWAALPIGTYTPETSLGLGAFASHFFRLGGDSGETRPSSVSVVGLYTLREQLIMELIPEVYWDRERWHLWSRLDYRRYPNQLYAIGSRSPRSSEESYSEDRMRFQGLVDRALAGDLRIEGKIEIISMALREKKPGGLLDTDTLPGSDGGRSISLTAGILWDSRDHLLAPHRGELHEVAVTTAGEAIGSEYAFSSVVFDFRKYVPITATNTLAVQLYTELKGGNVPFYKLAQLGGEDMLRGLYQGRFRDKALCALQAEYRLPLFWRFSGVMHAALGQVARDASALAFDTPEWSLGAGGRVLLNTDEKLNLRADLGVSREGYGIYIGIGEAF